LREEGEKGGDKVKGNGRGTGESTGYSSVGFPDLGRTLGSKPRRGQEGRAHTIRGLGRDVSNIKSVDWGGGRSIHTQQ